MSQILIEAHRISSQYDKKIKALLEKIIIDKRSTF